MLWQNQAGMRLASGPTGAGFPSARISGPRELVAVPEIQATVGVEFLRVARSSALSFKLLTEFAHVLV
jgi:hypothetical protein